MKRVEIEGTGRERGRAAHDESATPRLQGCYCTRLLRILHVTPYSADAWAYGGIPRLADSLTRALARRGHQVTVCTTDACDAAARLPRGPSLTRGGVDVRVFRNVSNALAYHCQLFLPVGLGAYLSRHARSFDVAHLHACRNVPGAMAAYHLHRAGVPYVLAPNGTAPRIERRLFAKRAFDALAGRRMLSGAARVLAVSEAERQQLHAFGVAPSAIRVIPNAVDLDEFTRHAEPGRFRRQFALPSGPIVLFLGKLTPRKRVDILARAFARLQRTDAALVIAGNDMGSAAMVRAVVRALGLERRTFFTGLLRGEERLDALADADVLVYPSEQEIFGLVPLEALLSGTPVIVADDSGCGEVVGATGGGQVVPPGDVDALARAMHEVLNAPAFWRAAAAEAATRVRSAFDADVVALRMEQLYEDMMVRRRAA